MVACLPFSERLVTSGVWVVGFEKNDFFEGFTPPADVMWTESTGSSLIVDDKVQEKVAPTGPQTYAFEVEVVGRRALCPTSVLNAYPIAVEQLRIKRLVGTR
jgi:NMD protein affecting ribosome stability and mRNA decay